MWLFTPTGFLSVVDKGDKTDDGKVLLCVRARYKEDLADILKYLDSAGDSETPKILDAEVMHNPYYDYRFRIFVRKLDFMTYMATVVNRINYDNFKDRCAELDSPHSTKERLGVLSDIWLTQYHAAREFDWKYKEFI